MSSTHFCTCPVVKCKRHPLNHNEGCDLCIKDNIEKKKMPACMFLVVSKDVSKLKDFSINSFVEHYLNNKNIENSSL